MSTAFDRALAFTLGIEGGESDDPSDHGGHTDHGVTQHSYDAWRAKHGLAVQSVSLITLEEIHDFYVEEYWTPCRCEEMPTGLGAAVFDMAVNSGPRPAILALQRAVGVVADGVVGSLTLAAAQHASSPVLAFLKVRGRLYRDIVENDASQIEFLDGWINRLLEQAWKGGVA